MVGFDPLKISYLVILGTDDPMEVTTFQGFSRSWPLQLWALAMLATLPADVLEPNHHLEDVIAHRMGGCVRFDGLR